MFVTFITITIPLPFYQIMDYRDTRAYILDPRIQEFLIVRLKKSKWCGIHDILWKLHLLVFCLLHVLSNTSTRMSETTIRQPSTM